MGCQGLDQRYYDCMISIVNSNSTFRSSEAFEVLYQNYGMSDELSIRTILISHLSPRISTHFMEGSISYPEQELT